MEQTEIVNIIIETINTIFSNIFSSIDSNIYTNLDNIAFINSEILSNSFFAKFLGENGKSGIIYLTDSMLLGISIYYCIKLFYSHYTESNIEKPFQFLFKILIFGIFINFSYFLIEQILNINYLISSAIQEIGKNILNKDITFSGLVLNLNSSLSLDDFSIDIFSLDGIIKSFSSVFLLNLLFTYSIRYVLVQVLILFCPFAFLSLINSSTSWIFRSWSKGLFSTLILQLFFPLIIMIILSTPENNNILFIAGIYLLTKINNYVREIFGGISIDFSGGFSNMVSLLKK